METRREIILSAETFDRASEVLTRAFMAKPLFGEYVFKGNERAARKFFEASLIYGLDLGRVFICRDEGDICGVAIWTDPGIGFMTVKGSLRRGMISRLLWLALHAPGALKRLDELSVDLEKYVPEKQCAALHLLASGKKGAGAAVLKAGLRYYENYDKYLESTVSKNDHAYYKRFGFKPYESLNFHGISYKFMILRKGTV